MRFSKTASVEELQAVSRYDHLRMTLLSPPYAVYMKKPLAFWALPTDRRLPLALMSRSLGELLTLSFGELSKTPGIGQKKMGSFVKLLDRAVETDPKLIPNVSSAAVFNQPARVVEDGPLENGFDPEGVTELLWSQWQATVLEHGMEGKCLGLFAPSLQSMTRVIWHSPLAEYTGLSLAELRSMKTHGEKRTRAILEVFYHAHELLNRLGPPKHFVVRLVPRLVDRVEDWIGRVIERQEMPGEEVIRERFVLPLLEQIRIDSSEQIVHLAEKRLGLLEPSTSIRQLARDMGLTRARVYQLLNEITEIMSVRWPMGHYQVTELCEHLKGLGFDCSGISGSSTFGAAIELFYPGNRRMHGNQQMHGIRADGNEELEGEKRELLLEV